MKRLAIILAILFFIAAAEWGALTRTKQYTDSLSLRLTALSSEASPLPALEALEEEWTVRRKTLGLFLHEKPMDEFERLLRKTMIHAALGSPDTAFLLLEAAEAAENIWHSERPSLQNIL